MAGRALTFADAQVIKLATEQCIPVASDDWYNRRKRDAEGDFFRSVSNQGPRGNKGIGGSTRQGMYIFTASGKLLGYRNNWDPNNMRREIQQALKQFAALPEKDRTPGAVNVPDLPTDKLDKRFHRPLPKNGLIIRVQSRLLEKDGANFKTCSKLPSGILGLMASRDHLWIQQHEWQAMIPNDPKVGQTIDLPAKIAERINRFHLVDNTRGEPPAWSRQQVRSSRMQLKVADVTPTRISMQFSGKSLLATDADSAKASRGFDVVMEGSVEVDRKANRITRFDMLALGDHWGSGRYTGKARPGRAPIGMVFERIEPTTPKDTVPPQAAREIGAYFGRY